MNKLNFQHFFIAFFLLTPISIFAQSRNIIIPLKIVEGNKTSASMNIAELPFDLKQVITKTQNNQLIKIERSSENVDSFIITLNKNDGEFSAGKSFILSTDNKPIFTQQIKSKAGKAVFREYEISAKRNQNKKTDYIYVRANYSAKGFFKNSRCNIPVYLIDMNADGIFTDDENGSNIGIDRNNDGKIWGKDEWGVTTEIIELCGKNYLISNLAKDGSFLALQATNLKNVKLFGKSPEFNFVSVSGKSLSSNNLKGKPYLLDFWATWCAICINKMPEIKQLEGTLPIIFINTDVLSRKNGALNIISKQQIAENSALRIFSNVDNFYKSFQRLEKGLPFYVLVDGDGIIHYGGSGGENLQELKTEVGKLIKN
jgi:thiol-disulfide isomerase/thioredoxin